MDWNFFFTELEERAKKYGRLLMSFGFSVLGPVLLLLVAHFVGYIVSFGSDVAQLLDVGSVVRFSFSAFLFFGLFLSLSRLSVTVVCAALTSAMMDKLLVSLTNAVAPVFGYQELVSKDHKKNFGVAVLGYLIGAIGFAYFYLGSKGSNIFIVFFVLFHVTIFGLFALRSSARGEQLGRQISPRAFKRILPLTIVLFAFVSGDLRGEYVLTSKSYFLSNEDVANPCETSMKSKSTSSGTVMLVSNSGFVWVDRNARSTHFIPWEKGYVLCVDKDFNDAFEISKLPKLLKSYFVTE